MGDGEQRTGSSIGRVLAVQAVAYVVLFGVTGTGAVCLQSGAAVRAGLLDGPAE